MVDSVFDKDSAERRIKPRRASTHFTLQVNSSTIVGEARVVRRTETFVGVEFVKRQTGA